MQIFNGKKTAEKILSDLKKIIRREKIMAKIAVVSTGDNKASELFIKNKNKAAKKIGIKTVRYKFTRKVKEKEIIKKINNLNEDSSINGIIVQLPLPEGFNTEKILSKISQEKDIDGFHKKTHFSSPLISGILIALKKFKKTLKNEKIIVLVNSDIFGRTLKKKLEKDKIKCNYLLKKKFSSLKLKTKLKAADILITVLGSPNLIKGDMIKKGAVLIDGGITLVKNKVVGDVDRKSVKNKAAFLTPVPGGLGPLTVALLLKNVYLASKKYGLR